MNKVTINGREYTIPEVDFDAVCELEEKGVDLLAADAKHPKIAITLRGIVAWIMGVPEKVASREIMEHIQNGGNIIEILNTVTEAMQDSGFFGQRETANVMRMPQDHQRKRKNKNRNGNRYNNARTTNDSQTS
jgi:hypothetical protein